MKKIAIFIIVFFTSCILNGQNQEFLDLNIHIANNNNSYSNDKYYVFLKINSNNSLRLSSENQLHIANTFENINLLIKKDGETVLKFDSLQNFINNSKTIDILCIINENAAPNQIKIFFKDSIISFNNVYKNFHTIIINNNYRKQNVHLIKYKRTYTKLYPSFKSILIRLSRFIF